MRVFHGMSVVTVVLLTGLMSGAPSLAAGSDGEIWFGSYVPDPSVVDSDYAFGARALVERAENLSYGVEIGYVSTSGETVSGSTTTRLEWESLFLDFVSDLAVGTNPKVQPVFTFGMGAAFQNAEASTAGPIGSVEVDNIDATSFTLQGAFGVKIGLGESAFLRPAVRIRWFEDRDDDDLDTEYLIGIGRRW